MIDIVDMLLVAVLASLSCIFDRIRRLKVRAYPCGYPILSRKGQKETVGPILLDSSGRSLFL